MVMFMVQAVITTKMSENLLNQFWDEWFPLDKEKLDQVKNYFQDLKLEKLSLSDLIKTHYLNQKYQINKKLGASSYRELLLDPVIYQNITSSEFFKVMSLLDQIQEFKDLIVKNLKDQNEEWYEFFHSCVSPGPLSNEQLKELLLFELEQDDSLVGRYSEGVKLYLILNQDRKSPGFFVLKDHANQWVRNENGDLWHQQALASSKHDLPFYSANGETPLGIMTIDSVMPEANNQRIFGKNRRLVLNFISKSNDESRMKDFIPFEHHELNWWKQSVIARDLGRRYFRIHGTGIKSPEDFPFIRTSGCIAQREVDGKYNDQRVLLNNLMKAMNLEPQFENESLIKGILTIVESYSRDSGNLLKDIEKLIEVF